MLVAEIKMSLSSDGRLSECLIETNCLLVEWSFSNIDSSYSILRLKELQEEGIKTETIPWIKEEENYFFLKFAI